jgi:hypothetical protein
MPSAAGSSDSPNSASVALLPEPYIASNVELAGSSASTPTIVAGGTPTERWLAAGAHSWTITGTNVIYYPIGYDHQFFITFAASPSGAGTVPASGWYNVGSNPIAATENSGYLFSQ